ncbi:hypothetical protein CDAR_260111 [Caerostris darwini]|uniref:Uncharacterized protein n=1 Tax=Caerostris darwini TaxID=1538125 RepID=A0AAV4VBQ7_9ARAC|nr:hypothetical protein CDAR_260111 [Caerostris darwini]
MGHMTNSPASDHYIRLKKRLLQTDSKNQFSLHIRRGKQFRMEFPGGKEEPSSTQRGAGPASLEGDSLTRRCLVRGSKQENLLFAVMGFIPLSSSW